MGRVCMELTGKDDEHRRMTGHQLPPRGDVPDFTILYLFAGPKRRSEIGDFIREWADSYEGMVITMLEWDTLRGGQDHDLSREDLQKSAIAKVVQKEVQAVIATAPCGGFSRAHYANTDGPPPLRSLLYPWGFPWLTGGPLRKTKLENTLVEFTIKTLQAAASVATLGLAEHPEDLGRTKKGDPASIWQLEEVRALEMTGYQTWAVNQREFGAEWLTPTRFIENSQASKLREYSGWPIFDDNFKYLGPLPRPTGEKSGLIGKEGKGFATSKSAQYPPKLCKLLADIICKDLTVKYFIPSAPSDGNKTNHQPKSYQPGESGVQGMEKPPGNFDAIGTPDLEKPPGNFESLGSTGNGQPDFIEIDSAAVVEDTGRQIDIIEIDGATGQQPDTIEIDPPPETKEKVIMAEVWRNTPPPPKGSGWVGTSKPIQVDKGNRRRDLHDGGGLCSPGRWRKYHRNLPDTSGLTGSLVDLAKRSFKFQDQTGPDAIRQLMIHLACGRITVNPFEDIFVEEAVKIMELWCKQKGSQSGWKPGDVEQPVHTRRLQAFLECVGDPDAPALDAYLVGVRLGAGMEMPRTPAIYECKTKWRLPWRLPEVECDGDWREVWRGNYISAVDNMEALKREVDKEVEAGRMLETTIEKARQEYGQRLAIASMGLIQEAEDKWRIITDGTHGIEVNNPIRPLDQGDFPAITDMKACLEEMAKEQLASKTSFFTMTWDFEKAHRIPQVARVDWGLQGCSLAGKHVKESDVILLNCCGTYGLGSASYYWGRLGAMLIRAIHYILGHEMASWVLLFADDGKISANIEKAPITILITLLTLVIFRFPVKWKKCHGGTEYQWIGYWEDVKRFSVGISEARRTWAVKWLQEVIEARGMSVSDFRSGLGRLGFVCGAIIYDKPFLGPLYTWVEACSGGTFREVPVFLKFVLAWLQRKLVERKEILCSKGQPRVTRVVELFRSDAKAEGDTVRLGGWQVSGQDGKPIAPAQARWYQLTLDRATAPWAYRRGEPFRTIASLELFCTLISAMIFMPALPKGATGASCRVSVGGSTDNRGNTFAVTKLMTTKFPLLAFVAELAAQMEEGGWDLELDWVPRDQNLEADALTNDDTNAFDPSKEVKVSAESLKFLVLKDLLDLNKNFWI